MMMKTPAIAIAIVGVVLGVSAPVHAQFAAGMTDALMRGACQRGEPGACADYENFLNEQWQQRQYRLEAERQQRYYDQQLELKRLEAIEERLNQLYHDNRIKP